ncbi:hypothetical protein BHE74_00034024 [Ensete ventricosum]|nr:hypothetical protein BHE74_00034024 [Ensete ventricosum]
MGKITEGPIVTGDGEERKMGAVATTWLGGSNKMWLQDDEGGSWVALEMKGGGWAVAFSHATGKKKGAAVRQVRAERRRGGRGEAVAAGKSGRRWPTANGGWQQRGWRKGSG